MLTHLEPISIVLDNTRIQGTYFLIKNSFLRLEGTDLHLTELMRYLLSSEPLYFENFGVGSTIENGQNYVSVEILHFLLNIFYVTEIQQCLSMTKLKKKRN